MTDKTNIMTKKKFNELMPEDLQYKPKTIKWI